MGTTKQRIALRLLLMTGLIAIGGLDRSALSGKDQESELAASVDRLVQAWEPIAAERRFDDIAWAKDIRDALRLGRQHNRPIFCLPTVARRTVNMPWRFSAAEAAPPP